MGPKISFGVLAQVDMFSPHQVQATPGILYPLDPTPPLSSSR